MLFLERSMAAFRRAPCALAHNLEKILDAKNSCGVVLEDGRRMAGRHSSGPPTSRCRRQIRMAAAGTHDLDHFPRTPDCRTRCESRGRNGAARYARHRQSADGTPGEAPFTACVAVRGSFRRVTLDRFSAKKRPVSR